MEFTKDAVEKITGKKVVKITELAFVVVATFESGKPQFIGKGKISQEVCQWDCGWMSEKFSKEWSIYPVRGSVKRAQVIYQGDCLSMHLPKIFRGLCLFQIKNYSTGKRVKALGIKSDFLSGEAVKGLAKSLGGGWDGIMWWIPATNLLNPQVISQIVKAAPEINRAGKVDLLVEQNLKFPAQLGEVVVSAA